MTALLSSRDFLSLRLVKEPLEHEVFRGIVAETCSWCERVGESPPRKWSRLGIFSTSGTMAVGGVVT